MTPGGSGGTGQQVPPPPPPPPPAQPPAPPPPPPATGAPAIQWTSGAFFHKGSVTVGGTGFGNKSQAAPVVWDDTSGTNILDKWDGAWPSYPTNPAYDATYRSPQRGISLPHNRITQYIAGAHNPGDGAEAGYNVMFWKNRTISSYPAYTYASWYQRIDDNWQFGLGSPPDDNLKAFAFSICCSPYELPNNWYIEWNTRPTSRTSKASWHIVDDAEGQSTQSLDNVSLWFGAAVNPMAGQWVKIEVEIRYSNQSNGYIKLWENGVQKINYAGRTDRYPGSNRTEGIGGYARGRAPSNWRYFADVYLDYTPARVVLANASSLSNATIVETQIPTSWSSTSISFTANLGKFVSGEPVYLYVFNASGQASAGYRVVLP